MPVFFGLLRRRKSEKSDPPRRKRGRPTLEMAAERRLQKLKDAETELKLIEIEKKKQALLDGQAEKGVITHEQVLRVVRYLGELGLEIRPKGGGSALDDDGLRGILRDLADSKMGESLGEALALMLTGRTPPLPVAPQPATAAVPPAAAPPPAQEKENVDPSLIIINQLQDKTPDQAAAWWLARPEPQAKVLARTLASTPDEQVDELLDAYAGQAPGLVRWLRARRDWTVGMVHALRQRLGAPPPAADVGL